MSLEIQTGRLPVRKGWERLVNESSAILGTGRGCRGPTPDSGGPASQVPGSAQLAAPGPAAGAVLGSHSPESLRLLSQEALCLQYVRARFALRMDEMMGAKVVPPHTSKSLVLHNSRVHSRAKAPGLRWRQRWSMRDWAAT